MKAPARPFTTRPATAAMARLAETRSGWRGIIRAAAINFDGIDDSVIYRFAGETWSAYTIAVWAKADVLWQPVNRSLFSNYGDTDGGFQLCFDASNNYEYHADVDQVIGVASLSWVHLAVTYDGTAATAYYNGTIVATFTPATDDLTFNKWAIGVNRGENNWFDGSVDDLRVYDIRAGTGEYCVACRWD